MSEATPIIDAWDTRITLQALRRTGLTVRQLFVRTDVHVTQLNSGKWRWVVRDHTDHTVGYGTEETKKLARAAAKECKVAHQKTLRGAV